MTVATSPSHVCGNKPFIHYHGLISQIAEVLTVLLAAVAVANLVRRKQSSMWPQVDFVETGSPYSCQEIYCRCGWNFKALKAAVNFVLYK